MPDITEYDVIIAGGGAAGCVIASRLATADPTMKILVLEAGPPVRDNLEHMMPVRFLSHILPTSKTVKFHVGKPCEDLGGRTPIVHSAACLGGGSSVNFMMYTRPSASDYDDWENNYNNPGWGSASLLPLLKKIETNEVLPDNGTHGFDGPLKVSYGGVYLELGKQFLDVASKIDKDRPVLDDIQDLKQSNAYARWAKWIDGNSGKRQDVPHSYIYNRTTTATGLEIMTGYQVKRVLFEDGRAVGVEFEPNFRLRPEEGKVTRVATARKLVVLSAGAFGSPAVLERSGIGSAERLSALDIKILSDLPGVGENYQDHPIAFTQSFVDNSADTIDGLVRDDPEETQKWYAQWMQDGTGMVSTNAVDAGAKLRPFPEDLEDLGADFRKRWEEFFANAPDKPALLLAATASFVGNPVGAPLCKYSTMAYTIWYSTAVGYLHITDAEDVDAPLDFDPKTINAKEDLAILRWGYKKAREITRRLPLHRGEYIGGHPAFPAGSAAAVLPVAQPTEMSAPFIKYTVEDDEAIDAFHRKVVGTMWHSLGTCAMKPREQGGVVDSRLNVYGVKGLKVADLSIAPSNVSGNTYSTALCIAEKAAIIIGAELGLTI